MSLAFGICEEDVETVLRTNLSRIGNSGGLSCEALATQLIGDLDHDAIERAALKGGCELDEQVDAAYAEIDAQLVRMGVLEEVGASRAGGTAERYRIHSPTMALNGCGFWSNSLGWVDRDAADTFSAAERAALDARIPFDPPDARWKAC